MIYFIMCLPILAVSLTRLIEIAIILFASDGVGGIGLASMMSVFAVISVLVATILISVVMALSAIIRLPWMSPIAVVYMLAPQQLLVTIAAFGAISAAWSGMYADGVVRSHWFILADQAPRILMFVLHAFAIIGLWRLNVHVKHYYSR